MPSGYVGPNGQWVEYTPVPAAAYLGGGGGLDTTTYTLAQLSGLALSGTQMTPAPTIAGNYAASDANGRTFYVWLVSTTQYATETTVLPAYSENALDNAAVLHTAATKITGASGLDVRGWNYATIKYKNTGANALQLFQIGFKSGSSDTFITSHGAGSYFTGAVLNLDNILMSAVSTTPLAPDPNVLGAGETITLRLDVSGQNYLELQTQATTATGSCECDITLGR